MPPLARLLSRNQYAPESNVNTLAQFDSKVKKEACHRKKSEAGANQPRSISPFLPEPQRVRTGGGGLPYAAKGLIIHLAAHAAAVTARHRGLLVLLRNLSDEAFRG